MTSTNHHHTDPNTTNPPAETVPPRHAGCGRHRRPPTWPRHRRGTLATTAICVFAGGVAAANWLTSRYGFIPVGLGLTATAGTYAAGFCLLARDWVHDTAGRTAVLAAIAAGGIASAVMAGPRLAAASAAAFVVFAAQPSADPYIVALPGPTSPVITAAYLRRRSRPPQRPVRRPRLVAGPAHRASQRAALRHPLEELPAGLSS
jgi:hypothetical protein